MPPPLRGQPRAALRALGGQVDGLRLSAYPKSMPLLEAMGLVEKRLKPNRASEMVWRLTPKGKRMLDAIGRDKG